MITIIVETLPEWEKLRNRLNITKDETFFTFLGENSEDSRGLSWFLKDNVRYAVRTSKPVYAESVRAKVHDS